MNGYAKLHPVGIDVRADMLETVAGFTDRDMTREFEYALSDADWDDAASLRWISALCARRIAELDAG